MQNIPLIENVAIANALQLEAARAMLALSVKLVESSNCSETKITNDNSVFSNKMKCH